MSPKSFGHRAELAAWWSPRREGWAEISIAAAIALFYTLLLLGTVDDLGYTRDEGFYFHAAARYEQWFRLLGREPLTAWATVDDYWSTNSEHPALIKSLFAWSHMLLWERWHVFSMEGTSYRFVGMALSGAGVGLVYLWGARAGGRVAGMVAGLSLAGMPRFFFHAHLACFDAPVVTMWILAAYCFWRAVDQGGWRRAVFTGVAFALALNTKHNAWFLPIVCVSHALLWRLAHRRDRDSWGRAVRALMAMATGGPLLFFLSWPWLWHETLPRLAAYARFHLSHVYYNMEFLGRTYFRPPMPRSYAFVMTAATVPTITLVLFFVGLSGSIAGGVAAWRRPVSRIGASTETNAACVPRVFDVDFSSALFWLLAIGVQYAAWLRPTTPIFGGTKHWMTAYPFVVLFAGVGAAAALRALAVRQTRLRHVGVRAAWVVWLALPGVVEAAHAHPWGLSSYSPCVGGASGAASLGLNRGFWGHTTGAVASFINRTAPRNARVYLHDTAWPAWQMMVRDGRLRSDLRAVTQVGDADIALFHHEQHMRGVEFQEWVALDSLAPTHVDGLDGVPVIWVYQRRQR